MFRTAGSLSLGVAAASKTSAGGFYFFRTALFLMWLVGSIGGANMVFLVFSPVVVSALFGPSVAVRRTVAAVPSFDCLFVSPAASLLSSMSTVIS